MSEKVTSYIEVGSNIHPENNVLFALKLLQKKVQVKRTSTFYWTNSIGSNDPNPFLNGVWQIETDCTPGNLKSEILKPIEAVLKRDHSADKYAPRTIDLDILLYGDWLSDDENLKIPHPDLHERFFILECLDELNPSLILPDKQVAVQELIKAVIPSDITSDLPFTKQLEKIIKG